MQQANRINKNGELVITSVRACSAFVSHALLLCESQQVGRTQAGNYEDCVQKLFEMIVEAAYMPPPPSEQTQQRIQASYVLSHHSQIAHVLLALAFLQQCCLRRHPSS